jgi:hypothetical protein
MGHRAAARGRRGKGETFNINRRRVAAPASCNVQNRAQAHPEKQKKQNLPKFQAAGFAPDPVGGDWDDQKVISDAGNR